MPRELKFMEDMELVEPMKLRKLNLLKKLMLKMNLKLSKLNNLNYQKIHGYLILILRKHQ